MKNASEQIYEAVGEGYGYNGSKEDCIKVIEEILRSQSELPSDEDIEKEANYRFTTGHGATDHYSVDVFINACKWLNEKHINSIAARDARIKELEESKITPNGFFVVARNSEEDWEQITQQMDSLEKAKNYLNDAFCKKKYPYAFIVAKII